MPVEIDVFDFKCLNQLRNGVDFASNGSFSTPNLVGNVGEKVQIEFTVNIGVSAYAEKDIDSWYLDTSQNEIVRSSGSFWDDGIQEGDQFNFEADWENRKNTPAEYVGEVTFISGDGSTLRYNVVLFSNTTTGEQTNVGIIFDQYPKGAGTSGEINASTALFLRFGLISNDETFNAVSKTTGGVQSYYVGGMQKGQLSQMESTGKIKDWQSGKAEVLFDGSLIGSLTAQYKITHEFIINPFYILAYREFIDAGTVPPLLAGGESLKYAFEVDFRKTLSNTGSSKKQRFERLGGFVGWYGENFNGLNVDYKVTSVSYQTTTGTVLETIDSIHINELTTVRIEVEGINSTLTSVPYLGAYFYRIPKDEGDYIGTQTNLVDNYIWKSFISGQGASSPGTFSFLTGDGKAVLRFNISFTNEEKSKLSIDDEYLLAVQVEDRTLSPGNSNRVALIADLKNFTDTDYISDFINVESFGFLTHGQVLGSNALKTSPLLSNEDGILLTSVFGSNKLRSVLINNINASLIAYDIAQDKGFQLDDYSFNLGGIVFEDERQVIDLETTRGYPLVEGDQFNLVKIASLPSVGDYDRFNLTLGQKIKWQEWILNALADPVFFDPSKPNNNLNYKSSNYSGEQGFEVRIALTINVTGFNDLGGQVTGDFIHYSDVLTVNDYGESSDGVSGVIETFDPNSGAPLGGNILYNGKDTLFKSTFQNVEGAVYGIHRIEPFENQGDAILELSSVMPSVNSNILKPLSGENSLKLIKSGFTVTLECLIDGATVQEGVSYKLSSRISKSPEPINNNTVYVYNESEQRTVYVYNESEGNTIYVYNENEGLGGLDEILDMEL